MTNLGIDYSSYQYDPNAWMKTYNYTPSSNTNSVFDETQTQDLVSGNQCTDGKDDGKIGFWGATWSCIKGAGKGILKGIKGAFTDGNGKFSLGKTLFSAALAATCIAFPAVGFAACTLGVVLGGAKIINNISNISNAKTDAQVKAAWEGVGDGTITVASSAVGMKASYGAIKSSGNALNNLGSNATKLDKLKAFGKDCKTSTVEGFKTLHSKASGVSKYGKALKYGKYKNRLEKLELENADTNTWTKRQLKLKQYCDNVDSDVYQIYDSKIAKSSVSLLDRIGNTSKKIFSSMWDRTKKLNPLAIYKKLKQKSIDGDIVIKPTISDRYNKIIQSINNSSFDELVFEFGYIEVVEALKVIYGAQVTNNSI